VNRGPNGTGKAIAACRLVLFDMDDTLYDERSYVESGFRAVARHLARRFGLEPSALTSQMLETLAEEGRGKVFDRILERHGLRASQPVDDLVEVYRNHDPDICLYPDVAPVLSALAGRGMRLGVVTDGWWSVQKKKAAALGLDRKVDKVFCTDAWGRECWKPSPAVFAKALVTFDVAPSESAYVGNDPAKDFAGPNALGMLSIHLRREEIGPDPGCPARLHATRLDDLVAWPSEGGRAE
jgi:putative hydrolase of the HAD superfamily